MATESKSRWWEDYLVRYLTPMLVGALLVLIVGVYIAYPAGFKTFLNSGPLWNEKKETNVAALFGILIAGFAYAYLCSTPITVFHAGRMIRAGMNQHASKFWYFWFGSGCLVFLGLLADVGAGHNYIETNRINLALIVAGLPALWMFLGQCDVIRRLKVDKDLPDSSKFVQYYEQLADSRGVSKWSFELRESYTHLREHANSVFICVAEISVAALIVLIWRLTTGGDLFVWICLLGLMLWISPNVFLWSIANRLERHLIEDVKHEKTKLNDSSPPHESHLEQRRHRRE